MAKLTKRKLRALVAEARQRHSPAAGDSVADMGRKSLELLAAYREAGLGKALDRDQPLTRFLAEHGTLVTTSGPGWTEEELAAVEKAVGSALPASARACLHLGGIATFRRNPDEAIRSFTAAEVHACLPALPAMLAHTETERTLSPPIAGWRYGMTGKLAGPLRAGARFLPLAPYYGEHGLHLMALHLEDGRGEHPVFIGIRDHADLAFYACGIEAWMHFHVQLTLGEPLFLATI